MREPSNLLVALLCILFMLLGSISGIAQTTPKEPPFVPDLNFNQQSDRVVTLAQRATNDGRVTVSPCGDNMCFRLIVPERLAAGGDYMALADGFLYTANSADTKLDKDLFLGGSNTADDFKSSSATICDALPQTYGPYLGRRYSVADTQNPSPCEGDSSKDCYEFWVITAFSDLSLAGESSELWSRKVRVEVSNPKTTSASITDVEALDTPRQSPVTPALNTSADYPGTIMETPNVTADGRLMVIQGEMGGILYSYNPTTTYDACDARGWTQFHPVSHMYYDSALQPTYGLAEYPIRDTEGTEYANNAIVRGTYPWLDRSGNLITFSQVGSVNPTSSVGGWDFSPVSSDPAIQELENVLYAGGEEDIVTVSLPQNGQAGLSFFGLWSRGKMVHLDGRANLSTYTINFNNLDQALKRAKNVSGVCTTYDCDLADDGAALVRSEGLQILDLYNAGEDIPINEARNTKIFSFENHLNYLPYVDTIDARDVTWQLQTARNVMEIAFDDFISPQVLIHSTMVPTITAPGTTLGGFNIPFFHDGFLITNPTDPEDELKLRSATSFSAEDARVQNAATAEGDVFGTYVTPPAYGELLDGARIEPIAAGGMKGRGLYLDGVDDHVLYEIETTGSETDKPWYVSFWLNAKGMVDGNGDPRKRELLHFPDGTIVQLKGTNQIRIKKGSHTQVVPLPAGLNLLPSYWRHVGIQIIPNQTGAWSGERTYIRVYEDGYAMFETTIADSSEFFQLQDGDLILGWDPSRTTTLGYRGWIDDFKVIHGELNPEEACRHAHGTLSGVDVSTDPTSLVNKAGLFPQWAHDDIDDLLTSSQEWDKYVCDVHFPETDALSGDLPGNSSTTKRCITDPDRETDDRCVGRFIVFPEGPLYWNAERPDSTANAFCLSCHTTDETRETMDPDIVLDDVPGTEAWEDERRQPTQPAQRIFGMIPSHFVGHMYDDEAEIWTDCFILSSSGTPPADCPF